MKKPHVKWINGAAAMVALIAFLSCSPRSFGQTYAKMKITTNEGTLIEGKKGTLGKDAVVLFVNDAQQSIPLTDVQLVMTKRGASLKYCLGFGGGCLVICLAATAINPNGDDVGTLLLGSALWAGIFGGVGALIGLATDPWQTVYFGKRQAFIHRFKLQMDTDYHGKPMLGLAYRF